MSQHWNYLLPTPPSGFSASDIKACYQFDGPTLGLTDRTGNGYTLSRVSTSHAWLPMKAEFGCNGALIANESSWLETALGVPLATLGAATFEVVMARHNLAGLGDTRNGIFNIVGTGAAETENSNFGVYSSQTRDRLGIWIEHGARVDEDQVSPGDWTLMMSGQLMYLAITRDADGVTYKHYRDGEYVEQMTFANAPTGSSGSVRLYIGCDYPNTGNAYGGAVFSSLRWSHACMTAKQIAETNQLLRTG